MWITPGRAATLLPGHPEPALKVTPRLGVVPQYPHAAVLVPEEAVPLGRVHVHDVDGGGDLGGGHLDAGLLTGEH